MCFAFNSYFLDLKIVAKEKMLDMRFAAKYCKISKFSSL